MNEDRGIYLIQSEDFGVSWSEALQVFNGAAAGFDIVGAPSLVTAENGLLHILWKEQSIQGDGVPQSRALYYSRSEDGGRTFSKAELVVKEPVTWREIVTDHKGKLHLFWQPQETMTTVWDQTSSDSGRSWDVPQGLPNEGMISEVIIDSRGWLHLVDAGPASLDHWLWDGSRWLPEEPIHWSVDSQQEVKLELLAAAINKQGNMVVVMTIQRGAGDAAEKSILYSARTLDLAGEQTTDQENPTPTVSASPVTPATATPDSSLTPSVTPDSAPTSSQGQTDGNQTSNRISPIVMALIPVALLLLGVLGLVIRRATRAEDL